MNDLPETARFHVFLNQSHYGHAAAEERVYPEDNGREYPCLTLEQAAGVLVRDGRCPEWIDVWVEGHSASDTRICLLCCGRWTDDPGRMYYTSRGMGPFGIKSPALPVGFKRGDRFSIPTLQPCPSQAAGSTPPPHPARTDSDTGS
ncbi:MAG TPA: hypothetical protein PKE29_15420 [Phycisphaerales bacterium]|nr:hypothetical protein [Phycisphaerales bacterium]